MNPPRSPPTPPLDQPLPAELTGTAYGRLTEYRRWPVFSAAWCKRRLRLWSVAMAIMLLAVAITALVAAPSTLPWGGMAEITLRLAVPMLLGPWLAWQVRRRQWPATQEWWALIGVLVLAAGAVSVAMEYADEPMKQWIAERTGQVGPDGKRRPMMIAFGVLVSDRPNEALAPRDGSAAGPRSREPFGNLPNFFAKAFVSFLFSGGFGLLGWRRERDGLARVTAERELRESETRRRETELKLSVLAAQVEPHFLFNTLASVRSAIATDPARASEMIDRLVDYLRASIPRLRGDGSADTTLGSQVEIVQAYLHLMRTRMKRLQISIDVPDDLRDAHFPPLMLISLAENAVKHGVEPKVGSARVGISARRIGAGLLEVSVADDGVGFGLSESGSGLGLVNIRERLRQLYGERASLALKSRAEGGVEATLALPLEFAGAAA